MNISHFEFLILVPQNSLILNLLLLILIGWIWLNQTLHHVMSTISLSDGIWKFWKVIINISSINSFSDLSETFRIESGRQFNDVDWRYNKFLKIKKFFCRKKKIYFRDHLLKSFSEKKNFYFLDHFLKSFSEKKKIILEIIS